MHGKNDFVECPGLTIGDPGGVLLPRKWPFWYYSDRLLALKNTLIATRKHPYGRGDGRLFWFAGVILFVYLDWRLPGK
jgi:hypothetical protein